MAFYDEISYGFIIIKVLKRIKVSGNEPPQTLGIGEHTAEASALYFVCVNIQ